MKYLISILSFSFALTAAYANPSSPLPNNGLIPLRLCTAPAGNNYHNTGLKIAERLKGELAVKVIETKGSWENLETMTASRPRCDAILAQEDAVTLHQFQSPESKMAMERVTSVFEEKVHLLCNRRVELDDLSQAQPGDVDILTNAYGSGSYITWRMLTKLNPKYRRFGSEEKGLDEALLRLLDNDRPTCLFYVTSLRGGTLLRAENNFADRLKLVGITDKLLTKRNPRLKRPLYQDSQITAETYPKLSKVTVNTLAMNAVFFVSKEWIHQFPEAQKKLSKLLLELLIEKKQ